MARGDFPSSKQDQFVLRLPDGMRRRIRTRAEAMGRSMNAEIVFRIDEFEKMIGEVERAEQRASKLESELVSAKKTRTQEAKVDDLRLAVEMLQASEQILSFAQVAAQQNLALTRTAIEVGKLIVDARRDPSTEATEKALAGCAAIMNALVGERGPALKVEDLATRLRDLAQKIGGTDVNPEAPLDDKQG